MVNVRRKPKNLFFDKDFVTAGFAQTFPKTGFGVHATHKGNIPSIERDGLVFGELWKHRGEISPTISYFGLNKKLALQSLHSKNFREVKIRVEGLVNGCLNISFSIHKKIPNSVVLIKPKKENLEADASPTIVLQELRKRGFFSELTEGLTDLFWGEATERIPPSRILATAQLTEAEQTRALLKVAGDKKFEDYSEEERKKLFSEFSRILTTRLLKTFLKKKS